MGREIISLHLGQAGVQFGSDCWELFGQEHSIGLDGKRIKVTYSHQKDDNSNFQTLYTEVSGGKYVPRAIFADLEPSVVDGLKSGKFERTFHPDRLIAGKEDAANNFARGHYSVGREMIGQVMDSIRKAADQCESLQGFQVVFPLFEDLPQRWRWYWFWLCLAVVGAAACRVSAPSQAGLCHLPLAPPLNLGCGTL